MKSNLLVLLAVILMAVPAAVGVAEEAVGEDVGAVISLMEPDCGPATSAEDGEASLEEILTPEATPRSTICGTCSEARCVGVQEGSACGSGRGCIAAQGTFCPGEGYAWYCTCSGFYY